MIQNIDQSRQNNIYTVSSLTAEIKTLLEEQYPFVWVTGEISNFRVPGSGHFYFILKDEQAQINAVMFRGQNQMLRFEPEDGMVVNGLGRISLYEPRGTYQIIFEYLKPKGVGALQIAFEQLKVKLSEEGLFDDAHKQSIPYLPHKIGIVTSPTGAVIHDIQRVLFRRFPNTSLLIYPTRVQGEGASAEISKGINYLNTREDIDVIILARGGGSLEDLHPFNSETVARAVFASEIPTISAIGHETDYTISDFVADLRAPTPSAAAETVMPVKDELRDKCLTLTYQLRLILNNYIRLLRSNLNQMTDRMIDPRKRIQDAILRNDDLVYRLHQSFGKRFQEIQEILDWTNHKLMAASPKRLNKENKLKLEQINYNLLYFISNLINKKQFTLKGLRGKLDALNPKSILDRGYSITQSLPDGRIVKDSAVVDTGQAVEVLLSKGAITCRVERKS